ncbi:putative secretion ATPase, PEP-CTERM locus subfamily [Actinobacillus pleuropneumoniae]|uniref:AAA family ATPase n=1 Tax=Actinobacillus pleuropneumoniae TaxID=715 RepID=UPI0001E4A4BE|nr:AAA family ATPase [Actinobacillus pleuropneumoniae]EFM88714.1 Helix-turn-helix domain protein [Actinobacillus pleuropneumoniae serovar 4 str. M62]UKH42087.1 helix-turn-helix domain-containing protein [Actinobacillus pleuropneumoniae serovar 4 str. M62]SQF65687.1 putative secretion ATPase, PEP-CTERM locus subfamily [Actinobacillus pleuropneumoniae]
MKNQELRALMDSKGYQQKQVAQLLGVSVATVSLYLKGEYNGNVADIDRKVDELIERDKAKVVEAKYNTAFVPTLAARRGMEVMAFAHVEGEINVIYGSAGLGKTQMLKEYERQNSSAVLIEVDPSCTPKVLLRKIAEAVGANARGVNNELLDSIVSKLKGSERLLMIDEAELLSTRSLEFIRRIHDLTGVGVVLAGMPRLLINLKGKNNELAQLYSRVAFACDLGNALSEEDLGLLAESALGTSEFNAPLIKASNGNARRLSKLMRGVVQSSEINQTPISKELVEQYSKMLIS